VIRRVLARSLLLLLVVPLLVVVSGAPAGACLCVSATPAKYLSEADAVFSGEVLRRSGGRDGLGSVTYTVRVDRVFKGEVAAEQEVSSGAQSSACGIDLQARQRTVFFASSAGSASVPAMLNTDRCSGTWEGGTAAGLGVGRPPTGADAEHTTPPVTTASADVQQDEGLPVLGLLGVVPLLGLGALALRRRRAAAR